MNHAPENGPPEGGFQPSPEFIQRVVRVKQAAALQTPDRVPFMPSLNMFYAYHYNMVTVKQWMEDCHTIIPSVQRYLADYNPDGSLRVVYLQDEIGGFAVHILQK